MIKKGRLSQKTLQRDLESEIYQSTLKSDLSSTQRENQILPLKKRQKLSSPQTQQINQQKERSQTLKESQPSKINNSGIEECLNLTSSDSGLFDKFQKNESDGFPGEAENFQAKTPSTSYSQPTHARSVISKKEVSPPKEIKERFVKQNNSDQIGKAATNLKQTLIWSSMSRSLNTECQSNDTNQSKVSENSSLFDDDQAINDFNDSERILKKKQNKSLNKKPSRKFELKQQQKSRKLTLNFDRQSEYRILLLLKAADRVDYQDWKNQVIKEQLNSDVLASQANLLNQVVPANIPMQDIAEDRQIMTQQTNGDQSFQSPILINPNNPIKDPITKKRVRQCANRFCFSSQKQTTDYKGWSRRKLSKSGQFMWLCEQCSLAYKNNQYCDFCIQIYLDSGDYAETDGKEWVQCEKCNKWEHTDCEVQNGNEDLVEKLKQENWKYLCPTCRNKKSSLSISSNSPHKSQNQSDCNTPNHNTKDEPHILNQEEDLDILFSGLNNLQRASTRESISFSKNRNSTVIKKVSTDKQDKSKIQEQKVETQNQQKSCLRSLAKLPGKLTPTPQTESLSQILSKQTVTTRNGKSSVIGTKKI